MWTKWLGVGLSALRLNPLRTVLSTLGVVIGVAALVAVLAIGDGVERFARDQIERTTDLQAVIVSPVTSRLIDHQRVPRSDYPVFGAEHASDLLGRLPEGAIVDVSVRGTAMTAGPDGEDRAVLLTACLPSLAGMTKAALASGRFFTEEETAAVVPVVVVSQPLAEAAAVAVGDRMTLQNVALEVVGVLEETAREGFLRAWVPLGLAESVILSQAEGLAPTLSVKAPRVEDVPRVSGLIEAWLSERFGDWDGRARVSSNRSRLRQAQQGMLIFKMLMGAVTGISLLVGGIGIMNVLLASVAERTREIGIRRSSGARSRDILRQFLAESVAVTSTGCLIGIALGWAGAFAVTALMRARTEALIYADATWSSLLVAAFAAVSIGLIFGLYPALRAARLSPIDAIRHE